MDELYHQKLLLILIFSFAVATLLVGLLPRVLKLRFGRTAGRVMVWVAAPVAIIAALWFLILVIASQNG